MKTAQLERWQNDFGNAYIERNEITDEIIQKRQQVWSGLLDKMPNLNSILEVGSNIGYNIRALKNLTKAELFALEPNPKARKRLKDDNVLSQDHIIEGSAFHLPFEDKTMDLVFTCGVLIHIAPQDLDKAYEEIYRVSSQYILSIEIFSKKPESLFYRGFDDMLYKRDFGLKWIEKYPHLTPIAQGFCWQPTTAIDDSVWWLFKK